MNRAELADDWRTLTDPNGAGQLTAGIALAFVLVLVAWAGAASVNRSRGNT